MSKKLRGKSRECHNHKPRPTPDTEEEKKDKNSQFPLPQARWKRLAIPIVSNSWLHLKMKPFFPFLKVVSVISHWFASHICRGQTNPVHATAYSRSSILSSSGKYFALKNEIQNLVLYPKSPESVGRTVTVNVLSLWPVSLLLPFHLSQCPESKHKII